MIKVENVSMHYFTRHGRRTVLDRINLTLERGRNIGILGRNGAGKSTLVRLLGGAIQPTTGRIHRGMRVSWPLAFNGAFQTHLTGLDNLKFICRVYDVDYKPLIPFVEQFAELGIYFREPVQHYSSGMTTRLALAAGYAALADAAAAGHTPDVRTLPSVFASSGGDGTNCHAICSALATPQRLVSPTRFHNSVNNAASGYWGIATGAMAASTIVFGYDGSFAAGLIEALALLAGDGGHVLLIAYDEPYPEPLHAARPLAGSFALGCLLGAQAPAGGGTRIAATLSTDPADTCADPGLETLRRGVPAAFIGDDGDEVAAVAVFLEHLHHYRRHLGTQVGAALRLVADDMPLVPLYRRTLTWAMSKRVSLVQWPTDSPELRWASIKP